MPEDEVPAAPFSSGRLSATENGLEKVVGSLPTKSTRWGDVESRRTAERECGGSPLEGFAHWCRGRAMRASAAGTISKLPADRHHFKASPCVWQWRRTAPTDFTPCRGATWKSLPSCWRGGHRTRPASNANLPAWDPRLPQRSSHRGSAATCPCQRFVAMEDVRCG